MRKWARQFEVKENDSSKDKQSKKRGAVIEAGNQGLSGAKWKSETRRIMQYPEIPIMPVL